MPQVVHNCVTPRIFPPLQNTPNAELLTRSVNPLTVSEKDEPSDDWELSPKDVTVFASLGEGEFGEVYKALLKGPITCSKVKPKYRNAFSVSAAIKLLKG